MSWSTLNDYWPTVDKCRSCVERDADEYLEACEQALIQFGGMSKAICKWSVLWVGKQSEPLRVLAGVCERRQTGENWSFNFSCKSSKQWHESPDLRPDLNWHESPDSCQIKLLTSWLCSLTTLLVPQGKYLGSSVLKAFTVECWSVPLMVNLDQHSIDTWSAKTYVDTWSTSRSTVDKCLLNAHESVDNRLTVNPVLIKFQSSVNCISFRMSLGEQSICPSRVLIEDTDRQIFTWCTWISWHSADYLPTVNQVSIEMLIECCPSIDQVQVLRG